jgi:hypothetical protein
MAASDASAMLAPGSMIRRTPEVLCATAIVMMALAGMLDKPAATGGAAAIKPSGG